MANKFIQEPLYGEGMEQSRRQEQPDTGPAPQRGTQPGAPYPTGVLAGMNYPPEGAYPIDRFGSADLAGSPAATAVVITLQVPVNFQGRIDGVGLDADSPLAKASLTWSLLEDLVPTQEYGNVPAAIGSMEHPSRVVLHVRGPRTITLSITNNSGIAAVNHFQARLTGWMWQSERSGP